jgi:carboxypeptidase Taq
MLASLADMPLNFSNKHSLIIPLLKFAYEIDDISSAIDLLNWDQQTQMPSESYVVRGPQIGTLEAILHEHCSSTKLGRALDKAEAALSSTPDAFTIADKGLVRELGRRHRKAIALPRALVVDFAEATSTAWNIWVQARADNDFARLAPYLARVVDLTRQQVHLLNPAISPYAALFEQYEPDTPLDECISSLEAVRAATVPLLERVTAATAITDNVLHGNFADEVQLRLGRTFLEIIGYRFANGRVDLTAHPFAQSIGSPYDVRVTTRLNSHHIGESLLPVLHEGGHALYEQGIDPVLSRTTLASGTSYSLHESQSRFWENIIGRSMPFWQAHYAKIRSALPEFKRVPIEDFVRALNRVQPSLIRVEADELTYNLHIIIRFEIERDLINGAIEVGDLPALWNQKYHDYLGITPPDDAVGVMQDVHWSMGSFGYFPTYTLGNLYAAQIAVALRNEFPDLDTRLAAGETAFVREWLQTHIHRFGRVLMAGDITERVTGERLNPSHFIAYITKKFGMLYGIGQ